eukprot:TRINITY_DN66397_c0_g1_i1.p1 TRINITY_DN66397_c0_g1~~TRINITY_DN66397_c0_g1_i1.p1  ORF type:complete len:177 (+),score=42.57 TRINITY_DN66397_c0_g1_i1:367-897(+)
MACWELGLQLKRDWLPELKKADVKLLVVGIGSSENAKQFAEEIGLPSDLLFADEDASSYQAIGMVNSDFQEDGRKRGMRMITQKTADAVSGRANGRPVKFLGFDLPFLFTNDDLETAKEMYKPLMPSGENAMDKTLVQGGVLVFRGEQQVYLHRDTSVGVHGELDKVLAAVSADTA